MTNKSPIAIVGGNGKTGARVNARLNALGYTTRVVSRSTSIPFDWNDSATWNQSLEGTRAAYVTYQPDLAVPKAVPDITEFVRCAREQGLEHIVLLSGRGEDGALQAEAALQSAGIPWTIVRVSWFNQNFSEGLMLDGILAGELMLPADKVREPFIDAEDIADVAVTALTETGHTNRIYDLTGPRALTFAEAVDEISRALGRSIRYTPIPIDDFIHALRAQGTPEDFLWLMRELFTKVLDGRNSEATQDIEIALKRPARSFSEYVRRTMETGVWRAS